MSIRVSVVVPTFKRHALLDRCLAALAGQDFDSHAFEVIVADDAASDETRALVETWAASGRLSSLRYLPVAGPHGPAVARNCGWRAARGEIIAFTDDDCQPAPDWLKQGVSVLLRGAVGVWGRVVVPLPQNPTEYQLIVRALEGSEFITANCFYRRDVLAAVGGFDERFTTAWREDSDLYFTISEFLETSGDRQGSTRLVHAPDAVVVHPARAARWGDVLRQQRRGMFDALLYKKHPGMFRKKIQSAPPWRDYRIVAALVTTIGAAWSGPAYLAIGAGTAWTFMTGRSCLYLLRRTSLTPSNISDVVVTSALTPPLTIFWRLRGALRFRVPFL